MILRMKTLLLKAFTLACTAVALPFCMAQSVVAPASLPATVEAALARVQVPKEAMVAVVHELGAPQPRLSWQAQTPVNPASLMKLLTTTAGLDLLGPAWTWKTPVWLTGGVSPTGVLEGNLVIKGSGDPKLVVERLWLLLRRVQQLGVREIRGDIVLDRSAFVVPEQNPADFDGEPLRPYNASADALLINFKAMVMTFTPDPARGVAWVSPDLPLANHSLTASVPLSNQACGDWRGGLKADFSSANQWRLNGSYPSDCGEKFWPVAYTDARTYNERAVLGLWRSMGGQLGGVVREGNAPTTPPTFELVSPALAEVIRDINKHSNNVMAQQLFFTLAAKQRIPAGQEAAREALRQWVREQVGDVGSALVVDNGSGLSRQNRVTAQLLAQLLRRTWSSPSMPELISSLPVGGIDGTLRNSKTAVGRTHLKTGSLRDVAGIAGYVLAPNGQRLVVVGIVNHANANAARPALDALVQWAAGAEVKTSANSASNKETR
jgi:D-alanyl-D-alanine carboxypeptidase/D-alanyl-D-alanine-endopeptidase (penicillin-binding protein 4)